MICRKIKKLIPVYLDGELGPQENRLVRDHLAGCPACREELEAFKDSWAMLGELDGIEPQPGFVGRFWTKLSLEQSWHERVLRWARENLVQKRLVPAFAAVCFIMAAGVFAGHNYLRIQDTNKILAGLNADDLEMVQNIELAENLDLIAEMDFYADLDIIENLDALETQFL